jgi:hypothetical protein
MLSGLNRSGVVRRKTLLGIWFVHRRAESQTTARETQLVAEIAAGNIEEPVKELCRRYPSRLYRFGVSLAITSSGVQIEAIHLVSGAAYGVGTPELTFIPPAQGRILAGACPGWWPGCRYWSRRPCAVPSTV